MVKLDKKNDDIGLQIGIAAKKRFSAATTIKLYSTGTVEDVTLNSFNAKDRVPLAGNPMTTGAG